METVILKRNFEQPITEQDMRAMVESGADCASIYRVSWNESFLSDDGHTLLCCFSAPDAEAVRIVADSDASQEKAIYPGTLHDTAREGTPNVVVERHFDEPVTMESLQSIEDAGAWCLNTHKVTFLRTYFSKDQKHMICLYQAPDTESVRLAQQQAGMPVDRIWPCGRYTQKILFS